VPARILKNEHLLPHSYAGVGVLCNITETCDAIAVALRVLSHVEGSLFLASPTG